MRFGPCVRRLVCAKLAALMQAAAGDQGYRSPSSSFWHGTRRVSDKEVHEMTAEAWRQVEQAIAAVNAVPDNPYGGDEEKIAAAILERLAQRKG